MKVLLVSKEFAPYSPAGGIATYTAILAEALARHDVDTHVLCVHPGLPRAAVRVDGYTVHTGPLVQPRGVGRVSRLPAAWGRLTQAFSVWREYRRLGLQFDAVEAPELYAEGLFIAMREKVPLVIRMHSSAEQLFPYLGRQGADVKATVALENAAVRMADIVVSTAPNLAENIQKLGMEVDYTRAIIYPVRPRPVATTEPDPDIVLFVGRLEPRKNPDVLVAAASGVLAQRPQTRFRFVGSDTGTAEGSYLEHLRELVRAGGVSDATDFAGPAEHEQVISEMARASVCAFPSRWESFGLVVAEAASIGRPVVVSDISAFRDFVQDGVTGRVVAVDAPEEWTRAVLELLNDRERATAMAERLRTEIARRADPYHVAELAMESYEAAAARRHARDGGR